MEQALEDISEKACYGLGKIPRRDTDFAFLRIRRFESGRLAPIGQIDHGSIRHVETTRCQNRIIIIIILI